MNTIEIQRKEIIANLKIASCGTDDLNIFEELIRADEKRKTIGEMTQTIREIEADTTNCLFDCPKADEPISCTICVLERAVEQMKGAENG